MQAAQVGQRYHAAWADQQLPVRGEVNVAVTAKSDGGYVRGLHTGEPPSNTGPFRTDAHQPILDHGGIRGGATHVQDDGV